MRNRWSRQSGLTATELSEMSATEAKFEYEYLAKFKGLSFRHLQWLTANDIGMQNFTSCYAWVLDLTKTWFCRINEQEKQRRVAEISD
jgi:hypothetical protein